MNYSAQQILHVYNHVRKMQRDEYAKIKFPHTFAFGNVYAQINDIFSEIGPDDLKCNDYHVAINFLGNINGKTQKHLYYKSKAIMENVKAVEFSLMYISNEKGEAVSEIHKHHGQPDPQHCILWVMSK